MRKNGGKKARQAEKHLWRLNIKSCRAGWSLCSGHAVKSQTMLKDMLKKSLFLHKWFSCLLLGSVIIPLLWLF